MARRPNPAHVRRLAKTASRMQADPPHPRPTPVGVAKLPDADTLIHISHTEHLDIAALARNYRTRTRYVDDVLRAAGYHRDALWSQHVETRTAHRARSQWADVLRDYAAGDPPLTLAARYNIAQQTIARNLGAEGIHVRGRTEASALRSQQLAEADRVRYQLRTGALQAAATDLGVDSDNLRAVLEAHELLLHDVGPA